MPRQLTPATTLDHLKREARRWLKALRAGDDKARERLARSFTSAPARPTLRDVQHALALEHGLDGWLALKRRLTPGTGIRRYDAIAQAVVAAFDTGEPEALAVVRDYFGHRRSLDATRRYVRLGLGRPEVPLNPADDTLSIDEARFLVARSQGFESWDALAVFCATRPGGARNATKAIVLHLRLTGESDESATSSRDWDEVLAALEDGRAVGFHAAGQMTDDLLEYMTRCDRIVSLDLAGSTELTDDGLCHLARLPELRHLGLSGTGITDRGAGVLRDLRSLETLDLAWTRVTDAGLRQIEGCERLRRVDASGTDSGDGAVLALAGKAGLTDFRSGNRVTDAGLRTLHELPAFRHWQGGDVAMALLRPDAGPTYLQLRGSFTDRGLISLVGLDGLFALNLDSDRLLVTGAGLAPLVDLPHLGWLAFDARDDSMAHIAALPHLRFLMCQDTTAGDDGFAALSRSSTLEYIWGRRCHNLKTRGFAALADMPALKALSVSCKNVDDAGLSILPRFPALRELMPMDVPDASYCHIGGCERLESLVLMYCRDTTDAATERIATLPALREYFASYTRITNRTPEILSGMPSLEEITFDGCAALTNDGIRALARLPRLRRLRVGSMPGVTANVAQAFQARVRVRHVT